MNIKFLVIGIVSIFISACASMDSARQPDCQASLTDNGDGTITDTATNLMWITNDYFRENAGGMNRWIDWENAISMAETSEASGYTNWRVPTEEELMSIVNSNCKAKGTTILEGFTIPMSPLFGNPTYPFFWTSTENGEKATIVNYKTGTTQEAPKTAGNTVRFVRNVN